MHKKKLRPVLDGDFWLLGPNPKNLDLPVLVEPERNPDTPEEAPTHECVDHHVFRSDDGAWHLWGCIRKTTVGRILYRWEGISLTAAPWQPSGEIIRVDRDAGESLAHHGGEECIQSPFVVVVDGSYFMFYGGGGSGVNEERQPVNPRDPDMAGQMCLMTSSDGRYWERYLNEDGQSRIFVGPIAARDPCLINIDGLWTMYYAGYQGQNDGQAGFYARTSADLIHWSGRKLVHLDVRYGGHRWQTECPHVVYRDGYYYLFRTVHYTSSETQLFRSEDPLDFGVGDASEKYVGRIAVAAPEIIVTDDGNEFITSNHNLAGGTRVYRLRWEDC
ncbi:MAG: hypothetical protein E4H27_02030 [Anaerolineales bacterium]|nr:MAG: hypothetical protein E4H27_02030 [Anaerolineales bacterium]